MDDELKAAMATADVNDLPDSAFAYIEPGGTQDAQGRTRPRSLRHLPIHDAAHVRNALARLPQTDIPPAAKKQAMTKIMKAAKRFGVQVGKASLGEMKAEPMDSGQLDRWLDGKIPRRVLMLPFGGDLKAGLFGRPDNGIGVDLDGEYFDAATDVYGPFPMLRANRERLVDWHHDDAGVDDPRASRMKGVVIGRVVFDASPEDDGYWADWWAKAGERRLALVKQLEERGTRLYGSSQAVKGAVRVDPETGHIDVWPVVRHTITTSPQNLRAAVPPLKALLAATPDDVGVAAYKAALVGVRAFEPTLGATFDDGGFTFHRRGKRSGKAGRAFNEEADALLARLRALTAQH